MSSGCTRIVGDFETTIPRAVTTWSIGISPNVATSATTMLATIQTMPRAERGTGALTIAVDGHWNSRMAGNVGSSGADRRFVNDSAFDRSFAHGLVNLTRAGGDATTRCPRSRACASLCENRRAPIALMLLWRLTTGNQPWSDNCMTGTLALEMAVLLRPELAIERAALEQDAVRRDVDDFALLHDQDLVAFGQ